MIWTRSRFLSLWAAYVIVVAGGAWSAYQLDGRLQDITEDLCKAVIVDLNVDLLSATLTEDAADQINGLIVEIERDCGDALG